MTETGTAVRKTPPSTPPPTRSEGALASARHTIGLVVALVSITTWGAIQSPISGWATTLAAPHARLVLYLKIVALQWLWVAYVWFGIRGSISMRALIDDSKWTALRCLKYLAIAMAGLIAYMAITGGLSQALRPSPDALRGLQAMLPHLPVEKILWAAFAISVGVCEEIVYRGYLLRQLGVLTGGTFTALVLQALCYGLIHAAMPMQMIVPVFVLGLLLGSLAVWQKSLVPGMILHVAVGLVPLLQPA